MTAGLAVITNTLTPAASYLLTDLPTVKDELGIDVADSKDDLFLTRTLAEVSDDVARYCNRVFPQETVQDIVFPDRDNYPWQIPGGLDRLQLSRWPVSTARATLPLSASVQSGNVLPFASTAGVTVGMPAALDLFVPSGSAASPVDQQSVIPIGAYVTGVTPNVSVTLNVPIAGPIGIGQNIYFGMAVVVDDPPGTSWTLWSAQGYLVDQHAGQLTRLDCYQNYPTLWYPVRTTVTYQGGFAAIPPNLVGAVLRIITLRYKSKGRDPLLKARDQPGVGSESYWIGSIPGVRGAYPEEIADVLNRFRVPVTA